MFKSRVAESVTASLHNRTVLGSNLATNKLFFLDINYNIMVNNIVNIIRVIIILKKE